MDDENEKESDEESFWTQRPKAHTVCLTVFVQIQVCSDQIYLTIVTFYISFAFAF